MSEETTQTQTQSTTEPVQQDTVPIDEQPLPETETFDRAYVEKLREEAASRRVALRGYEEAFGAFDEEDRNFLLGMVRQLSEDPTTAAQQMRALADALLEEYGAGATEAADALNQHADQLDEGDDDRPITRRELMELIEVQRQQAEEERLIAEINSEARQLGYQEGSRDYMLLLWTAMNETQGDLKRADERIKADRERIIQEYLAQKESQASSVPRLSQGTVPSGEERITDFSQAREALKARLGAIIEQ